MNLKLIVVRTNEPEKLSKFYSILGLNFEFHKHGNSPFHYSAQIGETIFEIYPLSKNQTEPDRYLRLGFTIENFEDKIDFLRLQNCKFSLEPKETEFGFMAIIEDLDGRKIELYKN